MEAKDKSTKVVVGVLVLAGLVVFSLTAGGGNLEPSVPPGPTMKTLDEVEPRIPIPASVTPTGTFFINGSGSYYLTGDRHCSSTGIQVDANDVTIDLMGYSLIGPGSGVVYGIYMNGRTNVEIRNGTIRDFGSMGIWESSEPNGKEHRVINVRLISNLHGIWLQSYGNLVKDCSVYDNQYLGIFVDAGTTVIGNTVHKNGSAGIVASEGCTVQGNTSYENGGIGIAGTDGTEIINNTVSRNTGDGIEVSNGCTVTGNNTSYSGYSGGDGAGIHVTGTDNRIEKNHVTNSDRGLDIDAAGNYITDNTVKGNTDNYDIVAGNQLNILLCEVPETIDWPAMVTLAGTFTTNQTAITVNASDVTINLGGHSLIGDPCEADTDGIYSDSSNVEVRNGTVREFGGDGIDLRNSRCRVINVRARDNSEDGIYMGSGLSLAKDCTACLNGHKGIEVSNSSTVTGNTANVNGLDGIVAGIGSTVTGNTAYNNLTNGIRVGPFCLIDQNTAFANISADIISETGCVLGTNVGAP
jgi:parallel beta-helix repeat protein